MIEAIRQYYETLFSEAYDRSTILIELALIGAIVYTILRFLHGTRGARLLRGLVVLLIIAPLMFLFYSLVHMYNPTFHGVSSLVFLAPVVVAVIVCTLTIVLMLRGQFALSAHFVLVVALAAAWTAIIL
ncbi:MAG TPA: hypothetical protein PLC79_01255, partial [Phycisphaerae bacterium]|nr:hypothetical protein [Phycisphaerae bacterium]